VWVGIVGRALEWRVENTLGDELDEDRRWDCMMRHLRIHHWIRNRDSRVVALGIHGGLGGHGDLGGREVGRCRLSRRMFVGRVACPFWIVVGNRGQWYLVSWASFRFLPWLLRIESS